MRQIAKNRLIAYSPNRRDMKNLLPKHNFREK